MIPKIIHYCWFGRGKMPELAQKCLDSWKKQLPEYDYNLWNEDNFDIYSILHVKEAYEAIDAGTMKLVGTDKERIKQNVIQLVEDANLHNGMSQYQNPCGDGLACERIANFFK